MVTAGIHAAGGHASCGCTVANCRRRRYLAAVCERARGAPGKPHFQVVERACDSLRREAYDGLSGHA